MKAIRFILAGALAVSMFSCNNSSKSEAEVADSVAVDSTEIVMTDVVDAPESNVHEFTADEKAVATDVPMVIDFNATWCGPCQKFGPVFHKVAGEYASKAKFAAADVDVCGELAKAYGITNIPAVVVIYPEASGKAVVTNVGYMDEAQFKAFLDANL